MPQSILTVEITPTSRVSRWKVHSLCTSGCCISFGLMFLLPDCRGSEVSVLPQQAPDRWPCNHILTSLNSPIKCMEDPLISHTHRHTSCRGVWACSRGGSQTPTICIQRFNKETKHKHSTDAFGSWRGDGFIWKPVNFRVSCILPPVRRSLNKHSSDGRRQRGAAADNEPAMGRSY